MQDNLKITEIFSNTGSTAIYTHVPFCSRSCAYCKFYKRLPTPSEVETYLNFIEIEAARFFQNHPNLEISSIFFGGGTPTALTEKSLERLCKIFENQAGKIEWTLEAAPGTISTRKLEMLKNMGVNRLSIGVQSFDEITLNSLGRPHPLKTALYAIDCALEVFENLNIDLIFGAPKQSKEMWIADLEKAATLPIKHISAYCLEFESGTSCCAGVEKPQKVQELEVDFLNEAIARLAAQGFEHYEISNYARAGFECKHNVNTWQMNSWIGFGPAAASQIDGQRRRNPSDISSWAKLVKNNSKNYEDIVELDDDELYSSALIFGLRMMSGVHLNTLRARFKNADFKKYENAIKNLTELGLLLKDGEHLSLSPTGIPLADSVAVELL